MLCWIRWRSSQTAPWGVQVIVVVVEQGILGRMLQWLKVQNWGGGEFGQNLVGFFGVAWEILIKSVIRRPLFVLFVLFLL